MKILMVITISFLRPLACVYRNNNVKIIAFSDDCGFRHSKNYINSTMSFKLKALKSIQSRRNFTLHGILN